MIRHHRHRAVLLLLLLYVGVAVGFKWPRLPAAAVSRPRPATRAPLLLLHANDGSSQRLADDTPTTAALARFALPALGSWLVSPLLSLVDTAVVGRCATSTELAALGPACMVGDSMAYLFSFLSVATTNLVASALTGEEAEHRVRATLATAVRLALLCGLTSAAAQILFGQALLGRYTNARSAEVIGPAFEYVRVRALGAPAALLAKVSIATCLAMKDSVTPLAVVAASGALNLALDMLLVPAHGIAGAAWATVASELGCAAAALLVVARKLRSGTAAATAAAAAAAALPLLPSRGQLAEYAAFARPLVVSLAGKIATYSALAHVATTVGVVSTAAHRVLMCVYWFAWPFAEVLSQVGQAFMPAAMAGGARRARPLVRKLLAGGVLVGMACGGASAGALAVAPQLFTRDAAVVAAIRELLPLVSGCIGTLACMCAMEGTLLASRQLRFLGGFYAANAVAMVGAFAVVERVGGGLPAAWACMLAFQLARLAAFALRLRVSV